jgi:inner membrane protein
MATILSHAIAAAAIGTAFSPPKSARFWIYGVVCSMAPDLDVIGFRFGVRYADLLGHRGLTHSILFAVLLSGVATAAIYGQERLKKWRALWLYLFLATISHAILDAFTDGGLGVAFFAPFVNVRYFFPWNPIEVSPIGSRFFSATGMNVLVNEVLWIWTPFLIFAVVMWLRKKRRSTN